MRAARNMTARADDRLAIADLVARFDDAVNQRDATEFAALWADDAVREIGDPMPMRVEGARHIIDIWSWKSVAPASSKVGIRASAGTARRVCEDAP
jgi:ketosteroid isomerase-like protein